MSTTRAACTFFVLIGVGVLISAGWENLRGAEPNDRPAKEKQNELQEGVRTFMRSKLAHSQKLLEALVLDDFATIKQEAKRIGMLSQAAEWQVLRTEEYLAHSGDFRRAADNLFAAADSENSEGAALAYMEMTMRCVRCHHYVRDIRMASVAPAATSALVREITEVSKSSAGPTHRTATLNRAR